jgi:Zn-dependent protease
MFARQSLSWDLPSGFLGIFVGLAFGFVIGLFYYQTYRKTYYWGYSIGSGILAAVIAPLVLRALLHIDSSGMHGNIVQFGAALVSAILVNHSLYILKKRHQVKLRSSRRRTYAKDLAVLHASHSRTRIL